MEIVIALGVAGLGLVACALLLFAYSVRSRDYQYADQLALLALQDDDGRAPAKLSRLDGAKSSGESNERDGE